MMKTWKREEDEGSQSKNQFEQKNNNNRFIPGKSWKAREHQSI